MMTNEEIVEMVAKEEKRLGVGSPEFMKRHNEIMEMIERSQKGGEILSPIESKCCGEIRPDICFGS